METGVKPKTIKSKTKRRTPCPNGERRNKKTGICEKYNATKKRTDMDVPPVSASASPVSALPAPVPAPVSASPVSASPAPVPAPVSATKTKRRTPCPNGERRNKKTGKCEKYNATKKRTDMPVPAAPAPAAPVTDEPAPEPAPAPAEPAPAPAEPAPAEPAPAAPAPATKTKNDQELLDRKELSNNENSDYDFLYPNLNDPNFNIKIAERKEFNDNQYDGDIEKHKNIEEHANLLCNSEFEMAAHQLFIRNFLSFQTPYNSLLLYHGLGSGKTCSAISVAEEMRDYVMQMGISSQIIIVASPNVQTNFRTQLFDARKLKLIDDMWNIRSCTGNKFLKEINPMNMKGLKEVDVMKQINKLIDTYYVFYGYVQFANYIEQIETKDLNISKKEKLKNEFNNRLIIIDEVHNIRVADDKDKRVANALTKLIEMVYTIRLLLLSATPMFNNYKEIIWLINLMNKNDRRSTITVNEVFNKDGSFKLATNKDEEGGQAKLERKATGYISFVRGENPYTFPYRLFPKEFSPENTFETKPYPEKQLNGTTPLVEEKQIKHISLYLTDIGEYQKRGYAYIMQRIQLSTLESAEAEAETEAEAKSESFGYTVLQEPLQGLNIIYPDERLNEENPTINSNELIGGGGLKRIMNFEMEPVRGNFSYKKKASATDRIFSPEEIGKYSGKIKKICDTILKAEGVILIYSQYIDAGLVPMALALEELGFSRSGDIKSLFSTPPASKLNGMKYVMITGDKSFSPNPENDIKMATNDDNINGKKVKVVLISQTGAEGLDLRFVRQVHILEPWYNMSRIEQIIGRAVRTCSHKDLPFAKRNVEIYLYASLQDEPSVETADLYLYRLAEEKAIKIGKVSRVLKEISIDCILNKGQQNFSEENMTAKGIEPVTIELASGKKFDGIEHDKYKIGDKPFSSICDYMESCTYTCRPDKDLSEEEPKMDTYNEKFIMMNTDKLILNIKQLMRERFFYRKAEIVSLLNIKKQYPLVQINAALHQLIEDKNEYIRDKYGRDGNLVNIDDLYLFQPLELNDKNISIFERSVPLDVKHNNIHIKLPKGVEVIEPLIAIKERTEEDRNQIIYKDIVAKYEMAINPQTINLGEKNWYMLCNSSIEILKNKEKEFKEGEREKRKKHIFNTKKTNYFIAQHITDELSLADILVLLNDLDEHPELFDIPIEKEKTKEYVFKYIKDYIKTKILKGKKDIKGILWTSKNKPEIIVKQGTSKWHLAEPQDIKDLEEITDKKINDIKTNMNKFIGFMLYFKNEDYLVFKTKDTENPRDTGLRCDQRSMKENSINFLNKVIGIAMKDKEMIIFSFDKNTEKEFWQKKICIIQELYLRSFDDDAMLKKRWFLFPSESVLVNIEKFPEKLKTKKMVAKKKGLL